MLALWWGLEYGQLMTGRGAAEGHQGHLEHGTSEPRVCFCCRAVFAHSAKCWCPQAPAGPFSCPSWCYIPALSLPVGSPWTLQGRAHFLLFIPAIPLVVWTETSFLLAPIKPAMLPPSLSLAISGPFQIDSMASAYLNSFCVLWHQGFRLISGRTGFPLPMPWRKLVWGYIFQVSSVAPLKPMITMCSQSNHI